MRKGQIVLATHEMVAHCFDVLINYLNNGTACSSTSLSAKGTCGGLFVTWEQTKHLRGCIGCLSSLPIAKLSDYAINASQADSRFSPITLAEVETLTCTVSILHSFELCGDPSDWTVGLHGIVCEFHGKHRATFLPHVMIEQEWDRNEAIVAAARKCGFTGNVSTVSITRYQSSKQSLSHAEYLQYNHK